MSDVNRHEQYPYHDTGVETLGAAFDSIGMPAGRRRAAT